MDKPPYTLSFKLKSARADAISAALAQLQAITADYDQTGETAATVTIEAWREQDIVNVRTAFEVWLHRHMIGITCEVTRKDPGVRPETAQFLRAHGETPMDALLHSLADRVGARVEPLRNGVTVARAEPQADEPQAEPDPDAAAGQAEEAEAARLAELEAEREQAASDGPPNEPLSLLSPWERLLAQEDADDDPADAA